MTEEMVWTKKGYLPLRELVITDRVEIIPNCRRLITEYRHNGEIVRTDFAGGIFRGPGDSVESIPGKINGA